MALFDLAGGLDNVWVNTSFKHCNGANSSLITYSVLISYCFALHPYEKHELIKPEWVIVSHMQCTLVNEIMSY